MFVEKIFCEALKNTEEKIISISPIGGMTNQNFLVKTTNIKEKEEGKQTEYCLRIANKKVNKIICRKDEKNNDFFVSRENFSVESVYFNDKTGVKITKFLNNSLTLNHQNIANKEILTKIA